MSSSDDFEQIEELVEWPSPKDLIDRSKKQAAEFSSEVLDKINSSLDKKKRLWYQIYENALMDRNNAYTAWIDLYIAVHGKPEQHAIHGQNLNRYLERMNKTTDQLTKLAELIQAAEEKLGPQSVVSEPENSSASNDDIMEMIRAARKDKNASD